MMKKPLMPFYCLFQMMMMMITIMMMRRMMIINHYYYDYEEPLTSLGCLSLIEESSLFLIVHLPTLHNHHDHNDDDDDNDGLGMIILVMVLVTNDIRCNILDTIDLI